MEHKVMRANKEIIPEVSLVEGGNIIALPINKNKPNLDLNTLPIAEAVRNELGEIAFSYPPEMHSLVQQMAAMFEFQEAARKEIGRLEDELNKIASRILTDMSRQNEEERIKSPLWSRAPFARRLVLPLVITLGSTFGLSLGSTSVSDPSKEKAVTQQQWVKGHVYVSHLVHHITYP